LAAGAASLALLLGALVGCGTASADGTEKIRFGLPTIMGANNSPLAVAKHMGYFKDEGLDVEIVNTTDSASIIQGVTSGSLEIGSTPPEPLMQAKLKGGPASDIVLMYNYIRKQTGSIAVLAGSDKKTLGDFKGSVIGQSSLGASNLLLSNGILSSAGLKPETDFKNLAVGTGAAALQALKSGSVDALSLWDTEYAAFEASGNELKYFTIPDVETLFSTTYFSTPKFVETNEKAAAGFGRAMAKATLFTATNPEAALRILYKDYPQTVTAGKTVDDQLKSDLVSVQRRVKLLTADDPSVHKSWGKYEPAAVKAWTDFALSAGIVASPLNPEDLYSNTLVDKYNDFDSAKIVADATNWKGE
jgi:NitT/TauT family transport system substrate-binding protein